MKKIFVLSVLVSAGVAQATTILVDDFNTGNIVQNVDSVIPSNLASTAATVFGGPNRASYIEQTVLDNQQRSQLRVGSGRLAVSNDDGVANAAAIAYGSVGISAPNTFLYNPSTNLSFGLNNALKFSFLRNDLNMTLSVVFFKDSLPIAAAYQKTVLGNQFTPFDVTISSSDLVLGSASWNDFDMMVVAFETPVNGDFSLDRVEAVPEPATLAALGAGLAVLARRRKNRS